MGWTVPEAWTVAVIVTADAYGVDREALGAASRGRGPRPPADLWEARKIAVYLATCLSDCSYAELGRHAGLHRDTVASHCADVRGSVLMEDRAEVSAEALERICRARLQARASDRLDAMRAEMARLQEMTADLVRSSDTLPRIHPTSGRVAEKNIVALPARRTA